MTGAGPRVAGRLTGSGDELPRIGAVAERELQHAEYAAQVHLTVRRDERVGGIEAIAPRSDDELAQPVKGIGDTRGCLGREPLVISLLRVSELLRVPRVQCSSGQRYYRDTGVS